MLYDPFTQRKDSYRLLESEPFFKESDLDVNLFYQAQKFSGLQLIRTPVHWSKFLQSEHSSSELAGSGKNGCLLVEKTGFNVALWLVLKLVFMVVVVIMIFKLKQKLNWLDGKEPWGVLRVMILILILILIHESFKWI